MVLFLIGLLGLAVCCVLPVADYLFGVLVHNSTSPSRHMKYVFAAAWLFVFVTLIGLYIQAQVSA